MRKLFAAAFAATVLLPASAQAASIVVTPTVAPNLLGSPYSSTWISNSIYAQTHGLSSYGDSSLPSYYAAQTSGTIDSVMVTSGNSWMGQADPGSAFGAAFANEHGNRVHFGVLIDGMGTQFSASQLSFVMASDDSGNELGYSYAPGAFGYTAAYVGVLAGADNTLWTADDVYITGGANTQMVDGFVARGPGNAHWPDDGCGAACSTPAGLQAAIDSYKATMEMPSAFSGTWTLGADSATGTFNFTAVPEPSTWALMIGGMGLVGFAMRRRNGKAVVHFA